MRTLRVLAFVPLAYVVLFAGYVVLFGQTLPWFDVVRWAHIGMFALSAGLYVWCLYALLTSPCFSRKERVAWFFALTLLGVIALPLFSHIMVMRSAGERGPVHAL